MICSAQHFLAKWLTSIPDPALLLYSTNCIQDSFTFAQRIRQFDLPPSAFLCCFAIYSLFTYVPLAETINTFADALYSSDLRAPSFRRKVFIKLKQTATKSVKFSFNNVMYRQIDGVSMGSLLGPALANIFLGHYESTVYCLEE